VFYEQGIGSMRRNAGNGRQERENRMLKTENIKFVVLGSWLGVIGAEVE